MVSLPDVEILQQLMTKRRVIRYLISVEATGEGKVQAQLIPEGMNINKRVEPEPAGG
jgi:hypothetical protein